MYTIEGDIWDYLYLRKIVIPVNQIGPMGKGLALQAKRKFIGLESWWKMMCNVNKQNPGVYLTQDFVLFPTKHHWKEKSDLDMIEKNLTELNKYKFYFAMPMLGCGLGERDWKTEVEPIMDKVLDISVKNRTIVIKLTKTILKKYSRKF